MSKNKVNASGNGKKRNFIIFILMLIVLGLCGASAYMFHQISSMKSGSHDKAPEAPVSTKAVPAQPPIYFKLDTFTVSLKPVPNENERVLYIGLTLRLKDEKSKVLAEQFLPEIRSRLLLLFSQQTGPDMMTENGKLELIDQIKKIISLPLNDHLSIAVDDVLFNAFILR